jgi:outer membrane receptor protein involved in Fe transport
VALNLQWAQRAATAAKEIKSLINDTVERVQTGTGVVEAARATAILTGGAATVLPYSAELFRNSAEISTFSAFADVTVIPVPRLEINLGGRYLSEDRDSGISTRIPNSVITRGPLIAGGVNTNGEVLGASRRFDAFLPRANILFRATDNVNLYATYSRGRRSPVVQVNAGRVGGVLAPNVRVFPAELLDNYEAGVKGTIGKLNFSVGAYIIKYKDFQISVPQQGAPALIVNADASNKGVEAEFALNLSDKVRLFANGA